MSAELLPESPAENGNGAYPRTRPPARPRAMGMDMHSHSSLSPPSGLRRPEREGESMEDGEFAAIVAPLEEASGIELENGGRALCFRDWRRDPEGFRRCAAKALAEGEVPVRLLVYWIKKRSARQSSEPSARRRGRKSGPCSSCGSVPLEQDERLIIVEKELGKALSKGEDSCGICNKPLRPGTKGTIGELGRRNPKFLGPDDEEFVIAWTHVECFKEERPPFCPECHVGGGRHDDDCKLVTGKR